MLKTLVPTVIAASLAAAASPAAAQVRPTPAMVSPPSAGAVSAAEMQQLKAELAAVKADLAKLKSDYLAHGQFVIPGATGMMQNCAALGCGPSISEPVTTRPATVK